MTNTGDIATEKNMRNSKCLARVLHL